MTNITYPRALNDVTVVILAMTDSELPYLDQALLSVFRQSLSPYEVIIYVEKNNHWIKALLAQYKMPPFILRVERVPLQSAGSVRNLGVNAAKTNWVAFLDADDTWHRDKLVEQYSMAIFEGLDFVGCDFYFINDKSKRFGIGKCSFPFPSVWLVNKEAMLKYRFKDSSSGEDADWIRRALPNIMHGRVAKPLANYRIHSKSLSEELSRKSGDDFSRMRKKTVAALTKRFFLRWPILALSYLRYSILKEKNYSKILAIK